MTTETDGNTYMCWTGEAHAYGGVNQLM